MAVSFFANKRIVVTGGAGFLGSFVVDKLRARGAQEVFVPRSADCDLVRLEAVQKLYRQTKPQLVFHLAARVGGIFANQKNPARFFYDNLMMGTQLLDEAQRAGVQKFIALATVCAYPKYTPAPFREDALWDGYPEETNAPYGMAKKMLLVQSQAYREQYGLNSIVLFPVNLYGPRDNFDSDSSHVIPGIIRKIDAALSAKKEEVVLWGDGTPTREFLYVEDAAEGILKAAELYDSSEPMNLGTGVEVSIAELAAQVGALMGYRGRFTYDTSRPNGQPRRVLDVSRARTLIDFTASTSFTEGLSRTIDYFYRHKSEILHRKPSS